MGLGVIIGTVFALTGPGIARAGFGPAAILLTGMMAFVGIAALVFGIMAIVLYVRMMRAIREQAAAAQTTWASAAQAGSGA